MISKDWSRYQRPILYRIDHEKLLAPKTPWLFLLLVIRLTISNATSAKPVNGLWTRRFIAMVLIARYIVEVSFAMQQLCTLLFFSLPLLVSLSQLRTPNVQMCIRKILGSVNDKIVSNEMK